MNPSTTRRSLITFAIMSVSRMRRCPAGRNARKLQHPLDGFAQAPCLGLNRRAVGLHAPRIAHEAVGQIHSGCANHGHRRAQLVRNRGHEIELLPGKHDSFFTRGFAWVERFLRDDRGRVVGIHYTFEDGEVEAKRIP